MTSISKLNKEDFWLKFDYNQNTKILKIASSFPILLKKEKNEFIIEAPTFNLFAYGNNSKEAKDNLFYQLDDFFDVLISKGRIQLTKWLAKLGWKYERHIKELDSFALDSIEQSDNKNLNWQITNINNNLIMQDFA